MNDDDLDSRLTARPRPRPVDELVLDRLANAVRAEAGRSRSRRLAAIGIGAMLALGTGVAASPVAADVVRSFLAQSDQQPTDYSEVPDSEYVTVDAPDFEEYLDFIYPDYLVPAPGQSREQIVAGVASLWQGRKGSTQEIGLRQDMELAAFCGWANEWTEANAAADQVRAQAAIDGMLLTTTWPAQAALNAGGIVERQIQIVGYASSGDIASFEFGVEQDTCAILAPPLDAE